MKITKWLTHSNDYMKDACGHVNTLRPSLVSVLNLSGNISAKRPYVDVRVSCIV